MEKTGRCMARLLVWISRPYWILPAAGIVGAMAVLAGGGCASSTYSARSLPDEHRVGPTEESYGPLPDLIPEAAPVDRIGRGDELEVQILTDLGTSVPRTRIRVEEDGAADVPLIRRVAVEGMRLEEARHAIAAAAVEREIFKKPYVSVAMIQPATNRVWVLGAVRSARHHDLPRRSSTLLAALAAAGGLSENAAPVVDILQPARPGAPLSPFDPQGPRLAGATEAALAPPYGRAAFQPARTIRVNLADDDQTRQNPVLGDGDVVVVGRQPERSITVGGLVRRPNRYKLPYQQDVRIADAVWLAGGKSSLFADQVLIARQLPGQEPIQIKASLLEARYNPKANVRIAPGDAIAVEETPFTFGWALAERIVRIGISGRVFLW